MACPFFMPVERFNNGAWPHPARLPLGGGWSGYCTAPGHDGKLPPQDILEAFCNLGYASSCDWAPRERARDAVRFAVCASPRSDGRGNGDAAGGDGSARVLLLRYVCERNHRPVEQGVLEFDPERGVWISRHENACIQRMAECFVESHLKEKS